ncbi:hypothetical protein GH714_036174 [Hevea brasiliensis]|uniref:Reverse transcriptase Ty1/copia-type domain-containing protein n=1 Tax=Hevea brasiliensis TaxID=3981 RepID=A0A6A6N9K1_HEVBR|nr:hypothetical protein GH714_036174 [Hevea brasiliensis]
MQAMKEEMQALEKNKTWDVFTKPENVIPVGCKWVYTVKYKADGSSERAVTIKASAKGLKSRKDFVPNKNFKVCKEKYWVLNF